MRTLEDVWLIQLRPLIDVEPGASMALRLGCVDQLICGAPDANPFKVRGRPVRPTMGSGPAETLPVSLDLEPRRLLEARARCR